MTPAGVVNATPILLLLRIGSVDMSAKTNKHHHQFPAALGRRYATIADAADT